MGFFVFTKSRLFGPEIKLLKLIPNQQVLGGSFRLVINVLFFKYRMMLLCWSWRQKNLCELIQESS